MLIDGWRGINAFGDIAIDNIYVDRLSDAAAEQDNVVEGLPIRCDFEVSVTVQMGLHLPILFTKMWLGGLKAKIFVVVVKLYSYLQPNFNACQSDGLFFLQSNDFSAGISPLLK